jgi:hypothetical protein
MKVLQRLAICQWLSVSITSSFFQPLAVHRHQIHRRGFEVEPFTEVTKLKYKTGSDGSAAKETGVVDQDALSTQTTSLQVALHNEANDEKIQYRRPLGSMELFMLPRPISNAQDPSMQRPPMNHVCAFLLSSTPSIAALRLALDNAVRTHPLLRARIIGDGEPRKWLDPIRKMVRWGGEEKPLEFVVYAANDDVAERFRKNVMDDDRDDKSTTCIENPSYWGGSLGIINIAGSTENDLENSWKAEFQKDLDSETVVAVTSNTNTSCCDNHHLWEMKLHRLSPNDDGNTQQPCALIITLNHCISDQGSLNMVMDQLLSDIAEIEESGNNLKHPAIAQPLPINLCKSVLGEQSVKIDATKIFQSLFSPEFHQLREYAICKVKESLVSPILLPSNKSIAHNGKGGGLVTPASILLLGQDLNGSHNISNVKSNIQYRWLPPDITTALVKKSKSHRVPISMTLAAAVAATCTDHFHTNSTNEALDETSQQQRIYKILQSLDTRRFTGASEPGKTLSCQAGGMDLMIGPLSDYMGKQIREHYDSSIQKFWDIAKQSFDQTSSYLKSGNAIEAVRLFDMGMTLSDIGRLVEVFARSNASMGRAWSAGITNAGEYERQQAVEREGLERRGQLQVRPCLLC